MHTKTVPASPTRSPVEPGGCVCRRPRGHQAAEWGLQWPGPGLLSCQHWSCLESKPEPPDNGKRRPGPRRVDQPSCLGSPAALPWLCPEGLCSRVPCTLRWLTVFPAWCPRFLSWGAPRASRALHSGFGGGQVAGTPTHILLWEG